jgi:hypothetical protein
VRLQVPLVPFSQRELKIVLLHLEKHEPQSAMATALSAGKTPPPKPTRPDKPTLPPEHDEPPSMAEHVPTSARSREASSSASPACSPRSRFRSGRWPRARAALKPAVASCRSATDAQRLALSASALTAKAESLQAVLPLVTRFSRQAAARRSTG